MSSSGFPDWQRITQWFAAPIDQGAGVSLDGGDVTSGPFDLLSFASVVVCVKANGGQVNVTVTQSVPGAPASLRVATQFVVAAGNVIFEPVVLDAGVVSVTFHEGAPGTSVDYALVPSNVNSNVAASLLTQLGFQHNDVVVANEPAVDLEDSSSLLWTLTDDPANSRAKLTATAQSLATMTQNIPGVTSFTPPAGTTRQRLEMWGAGAGGTACAASGATTNCSVAVGGGPGAYLLITDLFSAAITIAVGLGGNGGAAGGFNAGANGGATSYASPTGGGSPSAGGGSGVVNGIGGGTTPSLAGGGLAGVVTTIKASVQMTGASPVSERLSGAVGVSRGGVAPRSAPAAEIIAIAPGAGQPGLNALAVGNGGSGAVDTNNVSRPGGNGFEGIMLVYSFA